MPRITGYRSLSRRDAGHRFTNPTGSQVQGVSQLLRMGRERRTPWPASVTVEPRLPEPLSGAAAVVTFIGHSTFLIQTPLGNILTDPMYSKRASPVSWVGPRRVRRPAVRFDDLPRI